MRDKKLRFFAVAGLFSIALVLVLAAANRASAAPFDSSGRECENGNVSNYLGTTCALGPTVYRWTSYSCNSTPSSICERLGRNGSEINIRRDPAGPHTLLVGGTDRWDVKANEKVDLVIRGEVYGANGNLSWPHFREKRGQTGDGVEENITTVECGDKCDGGEAVSRIRCEAGSPEEDCTQQKRIQPYMKAAARFPMNDSDHPYPFSIRVIMDGGTHGTAHLHSIGLHIGPGGNSNGQGNNGGRFNQGRRQRPF